MVTRGFFRTGIIPGEVCVHAEDFRHRHEQTLRLKGSGVVEVNVGTQALADGGDNANI